VPRLAANEGARQRGLPNLRGAAAYHDDAHVSRGFRDP
jgi:hypothetical protein